MFTLALCASLAIASGAQAQSLGSRLGSPSDRAPNAPEPPPPPATAPPVDELPDWAGEAREPPRTVGAPAPDWRGSSGAPPDLVLTRDGGMIRGTIVQSQPGVRVLIQLATGDVQEIAWGDVRFAGRAEEAPLERGGSGGSASPAEPRAGGALRLRFVGDLRLTLHRLGATAHSRASSGWVTVHGRSDLYERACTAPCELWIDPGVHHFALAIGAGAPFPVGALDITREGTLRGIHVDNAGLRAAGGTVFAVGIAGAAIMIPLSVFVLGNAALLISGCVLGGLGLLIGIPMMAARSGVVLRFH